MSVAAILPNIEKNSESGVGSSPKTFPSSKAPPRSTRLPISSLRLIKGSEPWDRDL